MSRVLKLGFVPLTDAAPLIVAHARGLFAAEGLEVELSREASWATVRDKVAVGALDGAHMLAPMALGVSLGAGAGSTPMAAPIVLNRGGAAVTLSTRLVPATGDGAPAAIASLVARRRAQAASPLTFAVVFPHSIHDYLLRDWLARAGLDPDADVLLTVAPPPRMADLLADGVIEGFAAGEPWSAAAVAAGVGRVAVRSDEVWPDAPDKVLGVTEAWAEARPEILAGLIRALDRAAAWAQAAENRGELTRILAAPDHVGVAAELIGAGLDNIRFHGGGTNAPTDRDADWLLAQMVRWGQVEADMDTAHLARLVFRGDLYAAALRA